MVLFQQIKNLLTLNVIITFGVNNMRQQNCEVCEYKEMEHPVDAHCYMFKDKPEGRCGQLKPIPTKEQQEVKSVLNKIMPGWGRFL